MLPSLTTVMILAASPAVLSLEQAVAQAEETSPVLFQARLAERFSVADSEQAALLLPSPPALSAEYASDALTSKHGLYDFRLGLSQRIEYAGQRGLRKEAASKARVAAQLQKGQARLEAQARVYEAYGQLHAARGRYAVLESAHRLAAELAEGAARRFKAGDVSPVDATLLLSDSVRFRARSTAALADVSEANAQLAQVLGVAVPDGGWETSLDEAALERDGALTHGDCLEALAWQADSKTQAASAEVARRQRFTPAEVAVAYRKEKMTPGEPSEALWGLSLSLPLPLWQTNPGEVTRLRAQARNSADSSRARQLAQKGLVEAATARLAQASAARTQYRDLLPQLSEALGTLEAAFRQGQLGLTDYQQKRDALQSSQLDALAVQLSWVQAVAELKRLVAPASAEETK